MSTEEDTKSACFDTVASALLQEAGFDPNTVSPGDFPYQKCEMKEKKDGHLPRRVPLKAFSKQVTWRPAGPQVGQARLLAQRFPREFRIAAMQQIILPMCDGKPYLTAEGELPCPFMSTCTAIMYNCQGETKQAPEDDPQAWVEMKQIFQNGVQVEWQENKSYLEYMLRQEQASTQTEVSLKTHVVDTSLMYLQYLRSPMAMAIVSGASGGSAEAPSPIAAEKTGAASVLATLSPKAVNALDANFNTYMQGQSIHRFKEARTLLRASDLTALAFLVRWRKKAHYLHANAFGQWYFQGPEWRVLQGLSVKGVPAQVLVIRQTLQRISETEILQKGRELPKLARCDVTRDSFSLLCKLIPQAQEYFGALQMRFALSWERVPSGEKLIRRLIVDGEPRLQQTFHTILEQSGGQPGKMVFAETDPESEFGVLEKRLQSTMEAMEAELAEQRQSTLEANPAAPEVSSDTGHHEEAPSSSAGASIPIANKEEAPGLAGSTTIDPGQATPIWKDTRASAEARMRLHDNITVYDTCPGNSTPCPKVLLPGTIFLIPSPGKSRGSVAKAAKFSGIRNLHCLKWLRECHVVLVIIGHDPTVAPEVRATVLKVTDTLKRFRWHELIPMVQTFPRQEHGRAYIEYILVATGPHAPARSFSSWIAPVPANIPKALRLFRCGCVWSDECSITQWARSSFVEPIDQHDSAYTGDLKISPTKKQKKTHDTDDLFAELGEEAEEDGDDGKWSESTISEGEDMDNGEVEEDPGSTAGVAPAPPQVNLSSTKDTLLRTSWSRVFRQGMSPAAWLRILENMDPPHVVLTVPCHLQAGLLNAVLRYNDSRFGLPRCHLTLFHPDGRMRMTRPAQGTRAMARYSAAHMADHTLERVVSAYQAFHHEATEKAAERILTRAGSDAAPPEPKGASGSSAGAPPAETKLVGEDAAGGESTVPQVQVTKIINLDGNYGPKGKPFKLHPETCMEDSDTEPSGGGSNVLDQHVLTLRNKRAMGKHGVVIRKSQARSNPGIGLFANDVLPVGCRIPAKGPWFRKKVEVEEWLASLPSTLLMEAYSKRVVEVWFQQGEEEPTAMYKVLTSIVGFVNSSTGISQRPNAALHLNEDLPMGENNLYLQISATVPANKEITIRYGRNHQVAKPKQKASINGAP